MIPNKQKDKTNARAEQETKAYGFFIKVSKKQPVKKEKLFYNQHGLWKFQTSLLWGQFCNYIAEKISYICTALDINSFSW